MTSDFWNRRRRPAKTPEGRYWERRARRRQLADTAAFPVTVGMIADRDNLYHCYRELRREGGQAPGVDGLSYPDLSPGEVGDLLADLSRRVVSVDYRPQPVRRVEIPKPGTAQTRGLSIPVLMDRLLARAPAEALSPFWEGLFLDCSWGFRPGRNAWGMLLAVEHEVVTTGHTVLAIDDLIRDRSHGTDREAGSGRVDQLVRPGLRDRRGRCHDSNPVRRRRVRLPGICRPTGSPAAGTGVA